MNFYPPDPGKRVRIFYMSRKQGAYVALPQAVVEDLPEMSAGWFYRDEMIEMLPLKRMDMTDEQFRALPAAK